MTDSEYSVRSAEPYLVFTFRNQAYAIKTLNVREIIWLPELSPIEEFQPHIVGLFNLRGAILPVADIDLLFGHRQGNYQTSDSVIIVESEGRMIGIIVNEVLDVKDIAPTDIEASLPDHRVKAKLRHHYLAGEAKSGDGIIMLLDAVSLIKNAGSAVELEGELQDITPPHHSFCPDASAKERALFRERANNLRQAVENAGERELRMPVAVAGLGGELFGVDVGLVREFADIRHVTPVPCCPPRIIGNMNLRGNIITLVDIRGLLDIPAGGGNAAKAVITEVGETLVGIAVNDVFDVAYLRQSDLTAAPSACAGKYVKGVAPYDGGMMTVLDLKRIIDEGELTVDETV